MQKKISTLINVTLQIEGLHLWPEATNYLKHEHRHVFHITCKRLVTHSDREIEIIQFKSQIIHYLQSVFSTRKLKGTELTICNFGRMSCEDIAELLLKEFDLQYCQVLEDNENGAEVHLINDNQ